ncbi:MAG: class I SAM-dependent methyltransferase [Acidimicrobiaceae bacterium]|nr:class I SAM-dependent methyltransferase [Acidimicrobiaceae bacterium]
MRLAPPLGPRAALRWAAVEPILRELEPHNILEIGCGLGTFGYRFAVRAQYVGVEQDHESFVVAERRIAPVGGRVVHGTPEMLNASEMFDLLCAFEVLEHIEDDRAALASWIKRLNPGGNVLVSVPAWPERFGPSDERVGHFRRYTPQSLEELMREVGCSEVRHVVYGWPLGYALDFFYHQLAKHVLPQLGESKSARTAASGRTPQPRGSLAGAAIELGTAPFAAMQKLRPEDGVGLVGVGTT